MQQLKLSSCLFLQLRLQVQSFSMASTRGTHTVGITFDPTSEGGEDKSVAEAQVFYDGLKDTLYAIEVGNEFDGIYIR